MTRTGRKPHLAIRQIQGASERSPHTGQSVVTRGIVTATNGDGFWMQDPKNGAHASSGVFVATDQKVAVGDEVSVTATVREEVGDWAPDHALAETRLCDVERLQVLSRGNDLPDAVELPAVSTPEEMRHQWERFEGMRVTVPHAEVLGPENYRSVNVDTGAGMPVEIGTGNAGAARLGAGDGVDGVTGVLTYRAGLFQIEAQSIDAVAPAEKPLEKQVTSLRGDERHVTVASFNVKNLDAHYEDASRTLRGRADDDVGRGQFLGVANDIVTGLAGPDIVALQEVQDSDGHQVSDVTDGEATAKMLINHIRALGGPEYEYVEVPPDAHEDGGQPGGNIRVGYLFRKDRVKLVKDSVARVGDGDDAFEGTRKTLRAAFEFPNPHGGEPRRLQLFNNHFSSKSGSSAMVGDAPEVDPADPARAAQAKLVAGQASAAARGDDVVVALGDFNDFEDSPAVRAFVDQGFSHFAEGVPDAERYSHYYRGHKGLIDHVLVKNAGAGGVEGEIVHRNALFPDGSSDHDPVIVRLALFGDDKGG
jgi:predicted extracellular nuclease